MAAVTGVQNIFSGPASLGSHQLGRNLLSGELGFGKPSLLVGPGDPIEAREEQDQLLSLPLLGYMLGVDLSTC